MKPFNLEEALAGKPVVTRDGRKLLEIVALKNKNVIFSVFGLIEGNGNSSTFTREGRYFLESKTNGDLFMEEESIIRYMNVYNSRVGQDYESLEMAKLIKTKSGIGAIGILEITITGNQITAKQVYTYEYKIE